MFIRQGLHVPVSMYVHMETNSGCRCTGSVPLAFLLFLDKVSLCGPAWPGLELTTKLRLILSSEVYLPLPPEAQDSSCALPRPCPCFSRWNLPPRVSQVDQAGWQRPRGLPVSASPARGLRACTTTPCSLTWLWRGNSGPHACMERTLPPNPSPSPVTGHTQKPYHLGVRGGCFDISCY